MSLHETLTKEETFRDVKLKVMCKACVQAGLDTGEKTPITDITWTMVRMGIIFSAIDQEEVREP